MEPDRYSETHLPNITYWVDDIINTIHTKEMCINDVIGSYDTNEEPNLLLILI